jgi:hypothetical protein
MRLAICMLCGAVVLGLSGCGGKAVNKAAKAAGENLLSVDFQPGKTLHYKLVSDRHIELNFDPKGVYGKKDQGQIQNSSEYMEITESLKPLKVDENGFTIVELTFDNVVVRRSMIAGKESSTKDAVNSLQGKKVQFTVTASGLITDHSQLDALIKSLTDAAFNNRPEHSVKAPDMIQDFTALQWFMWDAVSSRENPSEPVKVGQSWKSMLPTPLPWPTKVTRETTYQVDSIKESNDPNKSRVAEMSSTYILGKTMAPATWPFPYSGSFQMQGVFGFLHGYNLTSLSGGDTMLYSITDGKLINHKAEFQSVTTAQMPFPLGAGSEQATPEMKIKQVLSTTLIK